MKELARHQAEEGARHLEYNIEQDGWHKRNMMASRTGGRRASKRRSKAAKGVTATTIFLLSNKKQQLKI